MGKVDLGMKLTCSSCGARFYDLNHTPAVCPKCEAENTRPVIFRTRRASEEREKAAAAAAAAAAPAKVPADEAEADAQEKDDDEKEDGVIEDTSDLGDEDVEVVVEEKEA